MITTKPIGINSTFKDKKWIGVVFFTIVILLLLPNLFTPLRLNTDGIRYLKIMEYLAGNLDQNSDAAHDFFPHGYPRFLLALSRLQLLNPLTITFINILSIVLASYLLVVLLKIKNSLFFMGLTMISAINIKQFTLPIADQFFTLFFLTGIYLWTLFFKRRSLYIIPALAVTIINLYLRTAGIALIAGVLLYVVYLNKHIFLKHKKLLLTALGCIIIGFVAFIFKLPQIEKRVTYISQLNLGLMIHQPSSIPERLAIHLKELGEILINIPYSKLSTVISPTITGYLLIAAGLIMCFILCKVVIKQQLFHMPMFWMFAAYMIMIFLWPFYDTRFLTPLVPLLVYSLFYYFGTMLKPVYIRYTYGFIFMSLGIFAALYSDALSLSNNFFLKHYGFDPALTEKYRIHFSNQEKNISNLPRYDIHTDEVLFLLEKYDRKPLISKISIN